MIMSNSRTTVGAWLCVVALPLFLMAQLLVAAAWRTPYSWSANNISDLGNVSCGPWGDDQRYVCSPLHLVMNTGFVLIGLLIVSGVILLWGSAHLGNRASSLMILLAGCGYVVVGLAPADLHENIHVVVGAIPIFFAGNAALLLAAIGSGRPRAMRFIALLLSAVGIGGTPLFLQRRYLGLGMGGMERVAAWPLLIFLALAGLASFQRLSTKTARKSPGRRGAEAMRTRRPSPVRHPWFAR
jgi:hypothetical membrane protein